MTTVQSVQYRVQRAGRYDFDVGSEAVLMRCRPLDVFVVFAVWVNPALMDACQRKVRYIPGRDRLRGARLQQGSHHELDRGHPTRGSQAGLGPAAEGEAGRV